MARDPRALRRTTQRTTERPSGFLLWLRRRRPLLRPLGWGLAGLTVLGGLAIGVSAFDPASQAARLLDDQGTLATRLGLTIERVELHGRHNTPIDLVRGALGIVPGDPMFAFSPQAARERLETISWIAHARVERHLPDSIVVRIEEREPFALWQNAGQFSIIDRRGRVVATERLDQFGPLPLLVGSGADTTAGALVDALRAVPEVMTRVQALIRVADRRWNLRLHTGTDVLLPEGEEPAAVARLAALQRSHGLLDRPLAAVDLRLADRMVLRPLAAPSPIHATPALLRGSSRR
ncbi:cell division protein FtsQ [Humitalea rosea]|uniref:Cell division protein FtsQ n=1 Tax=Humitalea rosea TaxID=990373 RepID=A0A2W7JSR2_9PROT|nr:cell division protein FtsQ/DivIB [Humitalea rosea]PZW37976.1 cell division protein FtsQ [Humitalea rosea]